MSRSKNPVGHGALDADVVDMSALSEAVDEHRLHSRELGSDTVGAQGDGLWLQSVCGPEDPFLDNVRALESS